MPYVFLWNVTVFITVLRSLFLIFTVLNPWNQDRVSLKLSSVPYFEDLSLNTFLSRIFVLSLGRMFLKKQALYLALIFNVLWASGEEETCDCGKGGWCTMVGKKKNCLCKIDVNVYQNLERCDTLKNHCLKSPCKNGATCRSTFGSFYCDCSRSFQGKLCDIPIGTSLIIYYVNSSKTLSLIKIIYDYQGGARKYVKAPIIYYTLKMKSWRKIHVAVQEFGDDFSLKFDDLNGGVRSYKSSDFSKENVKASCQKIAQSEPYFDGQICDLITQSILYLLGLI